ncbi:hypothetical protein JNUCC76_04875 [Leuconostoc sp. JNUCC 76]
MTIFINVVIGIIAGGLLAFLTNLLTKPSSSVKRIGIYVLGVAFGGIGAQAADQLLNYGPTFLNISIVPSFVGSIVLVFIVLYAGKKWLHL